MISKIEQFEVSPEYEELDIKGLTIMYVKMKPKKITREYMLAVNDITRNQYYLRMKYLKPLGHTFKYEARKSCINGDKDADIKIEPMNPDIKNCISYTPINQKLEIGTVIYIDEKIPYLPDKDGNEPTRLSLTSDNLKSTHEGKLSGHYNNFCVQHCDYMCAQDIGSTIFCKFEVVETDIEGIQSMTMFIGPWRSEDEKDPFFQIGIYKCWNVTPKELFEKMVESFEYLEWSEYGKQLVKEVVAGLK